MYNLSNPGWEYEIIEEVSLVEAIVGLVTDYFELNEPEDILFDGNYAYVPCPVGHNLTIVNIKS